MNTHNTCHSNRRFLSILHSPNPKINLYHNVILHVLTQNPRLLYNRRVGEQIKEFARPLKNDDDPLLLKEASDDVMRHEEA